MIGGNVADTWWLWERTEQLKDRVVHSRVRMLEQQMRLIQPTPGRYCRFTLQGICGTFSSLPWEYIFNLAVAQTPLPKVGALDHIALLVLDSHNDSSDSTFESLDTLLYLQRGPKGAEWRESRFHCKGPKALRMR